MSQLDFQATLADTVREAARAEVIAPALLPGLRHPERLAIHARHFRASLTSVIGAAYPAVKRLTGDGFFAFAAAQFAAAEPPQDAVLDNYGDGFACFLARLPATTGFKWLPHLARFEWALHRASLERPPCPSASPPEGAGTAPVAWHPSAALFAAPYAVDRLTADEPSVADFAPADRFILIVGDAVSVRTYVISWGDFVCLSALRAGRCLEDAIAIALAVDAAFMPASVIRVACRSGAIAFLTSSERAPS